MSTNSTIAIKRKDGGVMGIYCHWDGYPSYNGKMLLEHYSDPAKIEKLVFLGAISSLKPEVEPTEEHSFDSPQEGVVVAYHRDRGEKLEYMGSYGRQEYNYQFDEAENKWYYNQGEGILWFELTQNVCDND